MSADDVRVGPNDPVVCGEALASLGVGDEDVWRADADGVGGREEAEGFFHDGVVVGEAVEDIRVVADSFGSTCERRAENCVKFGAGFAADGGVEGQEVEDH